MIALMTTGGAPDRTGLADAFHADRIGLAADFLTPLVDESLNLAYQRGTGRETRLHHHPGAVL